AGVRYDAYARPGERQEARGNLAAARCVAGGRRTGSPNRRSGRAFPGGPHREKGDCRSRPHREYRSVMIKAVCLALALTPLVASCGFSPVYGTGPALANAGPVRIPEIQTTSSTGAAG